MFARDLTRRSLLVWLVAWTFACSGSSPAQEKKTPPSGPELAARAKEVFRTRCLECHGGQRTQAGVKILDRDGLVGKEHVVPNKPDDSYLMELITVDDGTGMPPEGQPRLSSADVDAIRQWIKAGAPAFPADVVQPAGEKPDAALEKVLGVDYTLKQILAHVRGLSKEARRHVRYFSINHLVTGGTTRDELDLHRDAMAKAINHLTWERELVRPTPIDAPANTVFAVDLRRLGWHKQPFQRIEDGRAVGRSDINLFDLALLEYPYAAIHQDSDTNDRLMDEYLRPAKLARPIPFVRADWFVSVATQSPLYEDFLQLPFELEELERLLEVNAEANLRDLVAKRAGMTVSGVSRNNRVVERHPMRYGAYWKSFDFSSSRGRENIFADPVQLNEAGGEMIFNLPNGLQGYFITNATGRRIDAAPTDIVTDKFADDKTVRNGLACMRCHDRGMKDFSDNVRPAMLRLPGSAGFDKRKILELYPEQSVWDRLLKQDTARFTSAVEQVLDQPQKREPLTPVSRRYLEAPLQRSTAAAELGLRDPNGLEHLFRSPQFASLGLMPLTTAGAVRRDMWEDYYDQIVRHLGLGIPVVPLDGLTRQDYPSTPSLQVELTTNKKNNVFAPGDGLVIFVKNNSPKTVHLELIGTSAKGRKIILAPATTTLESGQQFRFPETGSIRIQPGLGKERVTLLASDEPFPQGELLRGDGVIDRVIHTFYQLGSEGNVKFDVDPRRLIKKTLVIETR